MLQLNSMESDLVQVVSEHLTVGYVGLMVLEIANMEQIEGQQGQLNRVELVKHLESLIQTVETPCSSIFFRRKMGDDYVIYFAYRGVSIQEATWNLQASVQYLKVHLEAHLYQYKPIKPQLELNVGHSLCLYSPDKPVESVLYAAIKQALRHTRLPYLEQAQLLKLKEYHTILEKRSIRSVYQPIVSLSDGRIFGYEALTRTPEESSFQSPLELFETAKTDGSVYVLEKLAREKAIRGINGMKHQQKVFINIMAEIIHHPKFSPGRTLKLLEAHGLGPSNVVFEITERSSVEDFSSAKKVLQHYRSQGYQIAIDDAGAGYSSMQAIAELEPDYIKVDRSLIKDIHQDKVKEYIVETFISFAEKMNIRIIAEGIEQKQELEKLIGMGIHFGQGYYLGCPAPKLHPVRMDVQQLIRESCLSRAQPIIHASNLI